MIRITIHNWDSAKRAIQEAMNADRHSLFLTPHRWHKAVNWDAWDEFVLDAPQYLDRYWAVNNKGMDDYMLECIVDGKVDDLDRVLYTKALDDLGLTW